ncbi:glycosyl hydrolase family 18 protein [Bythopirellula polymerisocia]|uniref:chitinase n=1 Tax=Bythopirellula polymerisocia TaxID=2528003 RepID=A0A5C6CHU5_9BACT|nr:glycosyl hydrolase family 18 protein [Bythopirellula polymerisocia]TWU22796.1 Glycosyl hydrolases family 18 [Bythopirellula polymerisocia]
MRRFLAVVFVALMITVAISPHLWAQQESVSAWESADFRNWTFIPYWTTQSQLASFSGDGFYDHVSDVIYFSGVRPTASGDLNYHPWAAQHLATLAAQQAAHGFRYHMSMFDTAGGTVDDVWNSIVSNSRTRAKFVANIVDLLQANGMTGFNLDWERPGTDTEWANYTQLAKDLKAAIGPLGMEVSVDDYGYADPDWDDTSVFDARTYDQLFIMGYHYGAASNNSFANGKLALTGQGAAKAFTDEQLVLGIGTWGKGPSTKSLKSIIAADPNLAYNASTWSDGTNTWEIESRQQVREKIQLALDRNMAGVMNWALQYDSPTDLGLHRVEHHYIMVKRDIPDLNLDGKVNADDALALSDNMGSVPGWTGTNTAARFDDFYREGNWELGDHNGNGFVNQADANWLAGRFTALGVNLPDRLAYTGTFENFADGLGLAGRWEAVRDGSGNLPETGNYTQHGSGFLNFSGSGAGSDKYSNASITIRNQNSAEAFDTLNTEQREIEASLTAPIDLGQNVQQYFTFLVRQNTGTLLPSQLASDQRDLFLQFHDAAGTNQFDVSISGMSGQVGINSRADVGGDNDSLGGFLPDTTYLVIGKITGSESNANTLELSFLSEGSSVGNFTDSTFPWMLSAQSSIGFDPLISHLQLVSLYEANYTVSNIQIGPASHFFETPQPGDFDLDGDVDGDDFLKWQRGQSPNPLSQSDLSNWQSNYGVVLNSIATAATVPEPGTFIALAIGMTAMLCGRGPMKHR